ncbi:LEPR protein, partial [Polypterus senegalus]
MTGRVRPRRLRELGGLGGKLPGMSILVIREAKSPRLEGLPNQSQGSGDVTYIPPKVLTTAGSNVTVNCIFNNRNLKKNKIVWWLNTSEKIPEQLYSVVDDHVSTITLVNIRPSKPKTFDLLQCCEQYEEHSDCNYRYAEIYAIVRPHPPFNIKAEITQATGLLNISWERTQLPTYDLQYEVNFKEDGKNSKWKTHNSTINTSVLIQVTDPCVVYVVQLRCRRLQNDRAFLPGNYSLGMLSCRGPPGQLGGALGRQPYYIKEACLAWIPGYASSNLEVLWS